MKQYITLIIIFICFIGISQGCTFVDPMTRAQNHSQKGEFPKAIKILENELKLNPDSVPIKTLLAQAYSDYGLALCQDQNKPPKVKYPMAKENFVKALALNPNLEDAKQMYKMIEEIQASLEANNKS